MTCRNKRSIAMTDERLDYYMQEADDNKFDVREEQISAEIGK